MTDDKKPEDLKGDQPDFSKEDEEDLRSTVEEMARRREARKKAAQPKDEQ